MRKKLLGSLAALAASGGLAWGHGPAQRLPFLPPPSVGTAPAVVTGTEAGGVRQAGMLPPQMAPGAPMMESALPLPAGAGAAAILPNAYSGGYPGADAGSPPPGFAPPFDPSCGAGAPPYGMGPYGGCDTGGYGSCPPSLCAAEKCFTRVEYLMWFVKPGPVPVPLVTTSSPIASGITTNPTSFVLFGGDGAVNFKLDSGIRVTTGLWCDCNKRWGVELSGFLLEQRTNIFQAISDVNGFPVLARPFFEATTGAPSAQLISFPGFANGSVEVDYRTRSYGSEVNTLWNLYRAAPGCKCGVTSFNILSGFRWFALEESLNITSRSDLIALTPAGLPTGNTVPFGGVLIDAPATIGVNDRFYTKNNFYGYQIGTQADLRYGRWTISGSAKLGIGYLNEILDINGASALSKVGFTNQAVQQGGLFASSTNIGRSGNEEFALLPEGTVNFGYQICQNINFAIGYNVLFLSKAIRPGDQIDPRVNSTLIPTSNIFGVPFGPLEPVRQFNQTNFLIQGINFAITVKF